MPDGIWADDLGKGHSVFPNNRVDLFPHWLVRISGFSSLVPAIAVFLHPLRHVLKVLRSLGKIDMKASKERLARKTTPKRTN